MFKIFFIWLIKIYQYFISPLLGKGNCRFYPTCSTYARDALLNFNIFYALLLIFKRIISCHPFGSYDYDPIPTQKTIDLKNIKYSKK